MGETTTWRPIETAPKDGTKLLLFWPESACGWPVVDTGVWWKPVNYVEHWCLHGRATIGGDPTHWMPLPAPPALSSVVEG